jgi:hypothetical protein
MNNLSLKELQILREALEQVALKIDYDTFVELRNKLDATLHSLGYKWERKAFHNEWKKLNK